MPKKTTVTLWPPEHGLKPHVPIEVAPEQVAEFKANRWRDEDPDPQPETEPDPPAADPPGSDSESPADPSAENMDPPRRSKRKRKGD